MLVACILSGLLIGLGGAIVVYPLGVDYERRRRLRSQQAAQQLHGRRWARLTDRTGWRS